jgi:hypothetical protein
MRLVAVSVPLVPAVVVALQSNIQIFDLRDVTHAEHGANELSSAQSASSDEPSS